MKKTISSVQLIINMIKNLIKITVKYKRIISFFYGKLIQFLIEFILKNKR